MLVILVSLLLLFVSFVPRSSTAKASARRARTEVAPKLCRAVGNADCFKFTPSLGIVYLRPRPGPGPRLLPRPLLPLLPLLPLRRRLPLLTTKY